ncbi:MAG: cytochrome c biogenesis protein [Deltaproteobacteria bacterium]|nr:cytochrome c biogenesis protein [Deltaproteobacteria bacterium]
MGFYFLFLLLCLFYFFGWLLCCLSFFKDLEKVHATGERSLFIGLGFHLFYIVASYIELGNFPYNSLAGLLLFVSLLIILIYFILDFYFPNEIFEIIFPPLAIFFILLSNLISNQAILTHSFLENSPVFGKLILFIHASFSMLGYLLFGVASFASVFFLYQEKKIKNKTLMLKEIKVPSLGFLDTLTYKVIAVGFLFLTVGLLLGVSMKVVANQGHPSISLRQVLPMITWAVFAVLLLSRSIQGLRGKIIAVWSITGFVVAIISFVYEISLLIQKVV